MGTSVDHVNDRMEQTMTSRAQVLPRVTRIGAPARTSPSPAAPALGALGLLCVAASVVAVFVVRRASWARVTLIVLTAIAAAFLLIGAIGTGVAVVPLGAAGLTIALLARHDTVRWFDR